MELLELWSTSFRQHSPSLPVTCPEFSLLHSSFSIWFYRSEYNLHTVYRCFLCKQMTSCPIPTQPKKLLFLRGHCEYSKPLNKAVFIFKKGQKGESEALWDNQPHLDPQTNYTANTPGNHFQTHEWKKGYWELPAWIYKVPNLITFQEDRAGFWDEGHQWMSFTFTLINYIVWSQYWKEIHFFCTLECRAQPGFLIEVFVKFPSLSQCE